MVFISCWVCSEQGRSLPTHANSTSSRAHLGEMWVRPQTTARTRGVILSLVDSLAFSLHTLARGPSGVQRSRRRLLTQRPRRKGAEGLLSATPGSVHVLILLHLVAVTVW